MRRLAALLGSCVIAGCTMIAGLEGDYQLGATSAAGSGGATASASESATSAEASSSAAGGSPTGGAGGTSSSAGGAGGQPPCPVSYLEESNGGCYRKGPADDWLDAEVDCESDGGHLVVVDDATEDALVPDGSWIGYSERVVSGDFRWVNGSTGAFDGWAQGQPGDGGTGECVEARSDGWHDDICSELKAYYCEYDGIAADPTTY